MATIYLAAPSLVVDRHGRHLESTLSVTDSLVAEDRAVFLDQLNRAFAGAVSMCVVRISGVGPQRWALQPIVDAGEVISVEILPATHLPASQSSPTPGNLQAACA